MIFFYFLLTFIIELAVISVFLKKINLDVLFKVFFINLFTWPLAQLVYGLGVNVFIIELGVFIAEGFLLFRLFDLGKFKAFLISLVANLISYIIGLFFGKII